MAKKVDLSRFEEVLSQLKTAQKQVKSLTSKETLHEARKYAEASGKELRKWIQSTDANKVKNLIQKEAKELQRLQKQIPAELAKFSKFFDSQKKEFEKVIRNLVGSKVPAPVLRKKPKAKAKVKVKAATEVMDVNLTEGESNG